MGWPERVTLVLAVGALILTGGYAQTTNLPSGTPAATPAATTAAVTTTTPTTTTAAAAAATNTTPTTTTAAGNATAAPAAIPNVDISDFAAPLDGAVAADPKAILTTKAQAGKPTIIVDGAGDEVNFKGIGWYGFNIGLSSLGNLSAGIDAVSNDFKQIVYRIRMLGFNSVRVAFAFDSTWGINSPPVDWTSECLVPTNEEIMATLIPGADASTTLKSNTNQLPPLVPPEVTGGICNSDWPKDSTYQRFIWVIDYLIGQGLYVMLDFHSNRYGDSLAEGNESLYDQASWVQSWVALVKSVLENVPAAHGRLLIDLINEPDGYALTWETQGRVPSLGSYYIETIDALYDVCPGCLYLIEGGGQATYCGVNWGNGFITDSSIIKNLDISSPTSFFNDAVQKPWINQVVLAPHLYCPEVSGATDCFSGTSLYDALDVSYGYLTVAPGWCNGKDCHVFAALLDEWGSTLNNKDEVSCMASIAQYASGTVNPKTHAPFTSWFFWSWQPDSAGTGGIVSDDWRTILWEKIGLLTGGTKDWATGYSLKPWYLDGFKDLTPIKTLLSGANLTATTDIAIAPKAATPAIAPVLGQPGYNAAAADPTATATPTPSPTPSSTVRPGFVSGDNAVVSQNANTPGSSPAVNSVATFSGVKPLNNGSEGKTLSTGALAGIIVGGVVFIGVIAAAAILITKLRNPRVAESYTPTSTGSATPLATGV